MTSSDIRSHIVSDGSSDGQVLVSFEALRKVDTSLASLSIYGSISGTPLQQTEAAAVLGDSQGLLWPLIVDVSSNA